jgi:hypothetical protein
MTIVNRSFTYRGDIKVSKEDLILARIGKKTCTIRLGELDVAKRITNLIAGDEKLKIQISKIERSWIFSELTEQHAVSEGFNSLDQLYDDLRKYYGDIDPRQPVTVIHFELL